MTPRSSAPLGLLGLASLALSGCANDRAPNFLAAPITAKIPVDYRIKIVDWAKRYYAEPASVRFLAISDPVPVRTSSTHEVWLVCVELEASARGGTAIGPRRIAFGVAPGMFSAPNLRSAIDIKNDDCEARPLAWRAWSAPTRGRKRA